MRVEELRLPVRDHPASLLPLYPHQIAVWEGWDRFPAMLIAAKTGTGKTRAAMLPVLKRGEWAMAVYPTNELLRDQVRAVATFSRQEGVDSLVLTPVVWNQPDVVSRYSRADVILVPIDGRLLDQWQKVMSCTERGEIIRRLIDPDKPKIVFTNPDILFLILSLQYHAEPLEALRRYGTLIIDEFHLYQGVELAHALIMVDMARGLGFFRRLILLSATPHPEVMMLLERLFRPTVIDTHTMAVERSTERWRTAMHAVDVTPIQVVGDDPVEVLVSQLISLKPELERLRDANPDDDYLPAVVIVNSVLSAIRLEDRLVENGFCRESLAIIRGLSNKAIRETKSKLLALGTSAIEIGVDFRCDILLFEASEAASFLQRFGRVGRHGKGKAIVLTPPNAFQGMKDLPSVIRREDFEERVHAWYPSATVRPWFTTTELGLITVRTMAENLIAMVARDRQTPPELLNTLRSKLDCILDDYASRLGCADENEKARIAFQRCAAGKKYWQWLNACRRLNCFRTSMPSLPVHDFKEQERRQSWKLGEYEIDLATLLRRAVGLKWNDKLGMITICGIGKWHRVHASDIFSDEDCGQIFETKDFPMLCLYQDGESTPVSDLMCRENHVFTVVPRTAVEESVDWRLPVFESGKYLVAFDGAALLLLELFRRSAVR